MLEAGIAILVDQFGAPAVQCSCGNPLKAFDHDIGDADVKFDDRNKKWSSYDEKRVAKVKPAPATKPVEVYQLVDVEEPDTGLAREAGSDGTTDEVLPEAPDRGTPSVDPTESLVTVPDGQGRPADEATASLAAQGRQVTTTEQPSDTTAPNTVLT
ncbi:PASTA domain-containing protein [Streptomyces sp. B93]|nr:PASTA domain-containing protein [Streptomyces sp. B93]